MNLKVGDVVVLKSGGPEMTIVHIEKNVYVCAWFTSSNAAASSTGNFPPEALNLVAEST